MTPILEVKNISKKFLIGQEHQSYHNFRDSVVRHFKFPFLFGQKVEKENFWALKNVSFEVLPGDSIGIVGKNGAGKSTLLKILSRITPPTSGKIVSRGRIASLLEVGTGFHPELTGRENIFLNGSILGMKRREILQKFDEIVDFSGVEKFLDTPLKHYSSGMQLRLAFAVASFLDPEVLVIDEVLAVGDTEFQKKCLGKMEEISRHEGRTILFVSHNIGMVAKLCNRAILLHQGEILDSGQSMQIIDKYISFEESGVNECVFTRDSIVEKDIYIHKICLLKDNDIFNNFSFDESISLKIFCRINKAHPGTHLGFSVQDQLSRKVFSSICNLALSGNETHKEILASIRIPSMTLVPGKYRFSFGLSVPNVNIIDLVENVLPVNIHDTGSEFALYKGADFGCVFVKCEWILT